MPPERLGVRARAWAFVGEEIALHAETLRSPKVLDDVAWAVGGASARLSGPAVGATTTIQVLAPGPIRLTTSRAGAVVSSLLAGVASPAPARPIDLTAYGIDEDGRNSAVDGTSYGTFLIRTEAEWQSFTDGFPGLGMEPAPPALPRMPPADLATASLVVIFERYGAVQFDPPVVTRVDAAAPGLVEVVHPVVNHIAPSSPMMTAYLRVLQVAKLPEGAQVRVIRE